VKKRLVFSAMLVCLLAFGLAFVSCDNGTTNPGGDGNVPANLRNTKWERDNYTMEFTANQAIYIENRESGEPRTRTFDIVSAAENGKIMGAERYGSYIDDEEEFCSSYSVSGNTLNLSGNRSFSGTWTR
jgi:hypothetical protein